MPRAAISGLLCTTFLIASGVLGRPLGPNLQNVIGRKAGSFPNYDYSGDCPGWSTALETRDLRRDRPAVSLT
jgi:hypothetical protein